MGWAGVAASVTKYAFESTRLALKGNRGMACAQFECVTLPVVSHLENLNLVNDQGQAGPFSRSTSNQFN